MGMFGSGGRRGTYGALNFDDGINGGMPVTPDLQSRGFFRDGGIGRSIAGTLGDALLSLSGQQPIFAPAMQRRQAIELEQQRYDRERADKLADWQTQQQWKLTHPDTPDIIERMRALDAVEPGLGATYARNYAQNGGGAPQLMSVPGVGIVSVPKSNGAPAPVGPVPGTIRNGFRFKGGNPNDQGSWEPVGGAGSGPQSFR